MDSESDIIGKKIESGQYFSEAMNWFHTKFTRARTEFSYFFIICIIAILAFGVGVAAFSEMFPLSPGKNFIMGRPLAPSEHLTIHSIQQPNDTANDSIIKFMLKEYVSAREEYIEDRLDRDFRVVTSFSGNDVTSKFLEEHSTSNSENPVIKYGKRATKDIIINDIRLLDSVGHTAHDDKATRAIVNYTTILTWLSDNSRQMEQREADISFQYKQITVDQKTGRISEAPHMEITDYNTSLAKTQQTKANADTTPAPTPDN